MNRGEGSGLIWLTSYPKSGNTWVRLALYAMRQGGAQLRLGDIAHFSVMLTDRRWFSDVLEADAGHLTHDEIDRLRPVLHDALASSARHPQLFKVHDCWYRSVAGRPIFDHEHTRGAIYIMRDPRDVAISWSRFMDKSIDWAIAYLANPNALVNASRRSMTASIAQRLGHWSDHVTSWIDDSGLAPLVVRYEDMHADPPGTLSRMADYLAWDVSSAAITAAISASAFDRLADQERRHGFAEIPDTASKFFVSGRAGGWRDILTPEQAARVERDHETVMRRFGYL